MTFIMCEVNLVHRITHSQPVTRDCDDSQCPNTDVGFIYLFSSLLLSETHFEV